MQMCGAEAGPHTCTKSIKMFYYMTPNACLCPHVLNCTNACGRDTSIDFKGVRLVSKKASDLDFSYRFHNIA